MAVNGKNIMLMIPVSGGVYRCVAGAKSCKLSVKGETIEISSASSSRWKEFLAGREEWEVSTNHLIMAMGDVRAYSTMVGTRMQIRFGQSSNYLSGSVICTQYDVESSVGSLAKGSFRFQGTGVLT